MAGFTNNWREPGRPESETKPCHRQLSRITSYNVCYTKLLRPYPCPGAIHRPSRRARIAQGLGAPGRQEGFSPRGGIVARRGTPPAAFRSFTPGSPRARRPCRITSYNVCYTKLLRTMLPFIANFLNSSSMNGLLFCLCRVKCFRFPVCGPGHQKFVITSYSIHYTKLYEFSARIWRRSSAGSSPRNNFV